MVTIEHSGYRLFLVVAVLGFTVSRGLLQLSSYEIFETVLEPTAVELYSLPRSPALMPMRYNEPNWTASRGYYLGMFWQDPTSGMPHEPASYGIQVDQPSS